LDKEVAWILHGPRKEVGMWIEAIIPRQDLASIAKAITPLTIHLGEDGRLEARDPSAVVLVDGFGLRITCEAKLHWSVLGIAEPLAIHALTFVVQPRVEDRNGTECVVFGLCIERTDVAALPAVLDERATEMVNRELAAKRVELVWPYGKMLTRALEWPVALRPLVNLKLHAAGARIKVTDEFVRLAIRFRGTCEHDEAAPSVADDTRPPWR
jgi:hypothetical protein